MSDEIDFGSETIPLGHRDDLPLYDRAQSFFRQLSEEGRVESEVLKLMKVFDSNLTASRTERIRESYFRLVDAVARSTVADKEMTVLYRPSTTTSPIYEGLMQGAEVPQEDDFSFNEPKTNYVPTYHLGDGLASDFARIVSQKYGRRRLEYCLEMTARKSLPALLEGAVRDYFIAMQVDPHQSFATTPLNKATNVQIYGVPLLPLEPENYPDESSPVSDMADQKGLVGALIFAGLSENEQRDRQRRSAVRHVYDQMICHVSRMHMDMWAGIRDD